MSHKKEIIVLENSKINFQDLHEQLKSNAGLKLSIYTDKENFLNHVNHESDLVVLDVLTPGFNESLIKKTKDKTKAKVVVLTNNDSPSVNSELIEREIKKSSNTYKELLALVDFN